MAWFLELKHHGKDMYPILKEKFKTRRFIPLRCALGGTGCGARRDIQSVRLFQYRNPAATCRNIRPYFRKRPELIDKFLLGESSIFLCGRMKEKQQQDADCKK